MHTTYYNHLIKKELESWQKQMQRHPDFFNRLSKKWQDKLNSYIPEKVHKAITVAIKKMIQAVLFGAEFTIGKPLKMDSLEQTERTIKDKIVWYKRIAATEGGITGAGGFILAAVDFPILIGIKLKMLYDIATIYGFDLSDYRERIYLLHIFQLAFSSQQHKKLVYLQMQDWNNKAAQMPADINAFDWRNFQQEYRDHIDLAKLAQLIPVIGAAVGLIVNYRLLKKLGHTAMNAYRMRMQEADVI